MVVSIQGTPQPFSVLWEHLNSHVHCQHLTHQMPSKKELDKLKSKLKHWVEAPPHQSYFSLKKKGHAKDFASYNELSMALFGRIRSVDSKKYETQLAERVAQSHFIKGKLKYFLARLKKDFHDVYAQPEDRQEVSRYAFFYSPAISAISRGKTRNTDAAFEYLLKNDVASYKMAAFLADYAMIARDYIPGISDDDPDLGCALDILPNEGARSTHYNVNESNQWVLAARQARVRLGAGPSATTMQVLKMAKIVYPENDTLLALALALFEFWNRHANQKRSEIHTYHEVMVVARGFGVNLEPDMESPGEFEYPRLSQIP